MNSNKRINQRPSAPNLIPHVKPRPRTATSVPVYWYRRCRGHSMVEMSMRTTNPKVARRLAKQIGKVYTDYPTLSMKAIRAHMEDIILQGEDGTVKKQRQFSLPFKLQVAREVRKGIPGFSIIATAKRHKVGQKEVAHWLSQYTQGLLCSDNAISFSSKPNGCYGDVRANT